ncbi:MAG: hypothetical protein NC241_01085 [Bacteroides sp.]|nr:hypothetical protein [Bacteroides sp.]MCM1457295.1 hypothetical protein [Lachnoclostridium sp.]
MNNKELKTLIRENMRRDPGNPFFTRKVMNRLPEPSAHTAARWVFRATWLACAAILAALWLDFITGFTDSPHPILSLLLLWSATLFVIYTSLRRAI